MSFKPIADASAFLSGIQIGHTFETRFLEFKAEYRWQKHKANHDDRSSQAEELCRDVAQFANREGGTLLVGVQELLTSDGRRVADAIKHVEDCDGFKQWAEQAFRQHLTPATFSRSLDPILLAEGTVLAINVLPSVNLVALWQASQGAGIEYLYRTDHGKEWMNPDEVERHIMNGSRAMQIQLARVLREVSKEPGSNVSVELTPPVEPCMYGGMIFAESVFVNRSLDSEIELRINKTAGGDTCVRIPHGLISEAWQTTDGRLGLCLKVAIVLRSDGNLGLRPPGFSP